jgi:hypothetical protein
MDIIGLSIPQRGLHKEEIGEVENLGKILNEKGNKCNFTTSRLASFMGIISHISMKVFKCIPASLEVETPN